MPTDILAFFLQKLLLQEQFSYYYLLEQQLMLLSAFVCCAANVFLETKIKCIFIIQLSSVIFTRLPPPVYVCIFNIQMHFASEELPPVRKMVTLNKNAGNLETRHFWLILHKTSLFQR
jgi:hypothetical protein